MYCNFLRPVSFPFNKLQPLFCKTGGYPPALHQKLHRLPLFATFCTFLRLVSFAFNRLQPLFCKTGGYPIALGNFSARLCKRGLAVRGTLRARRTRESVSRYESADYLGVCFAFRRATGVLCICCCQSRRSRRCCRGLRRSRSVRRCQSHRSSSRPIARSDWVAE